MANYNFGILKATFTNYLNESENIFAKDMFKEFMTIIKESPTLQREFKIYKNLEEAYQPNETLAIKFIEDVLKEYALIGYVSTERAKLDRISESLKPKVSSAKRELYEHINTLIDGSLPKRSDVASYHKSFSYLVEYVKNNKPKELVVESLSPEYKGIPKDYLVKKAVEKFNEKFETLSEDDKKLFKTIISESVDDKVNLFNAMKEDVLTIISSELGKNTESDKVINEAIENVKAMKFKDESFITDYTSLRDAKENF